MSHRELERVLGDDLASLVRALDVPVAAATPLSGVGYPGYQPNSFRLLFADGRLLKGRTSSAARAARIEYVSQHLEHPGFPRVLARTGRALLTEWVEGDAFDAARGDADLLRQCGVLQGYLHSVPLPDDSPYSASDAIEHRRGTLRRQLDQLLESRVLEHDEGRRIAACAARHAPIRFAVGFVHGDFSAENVVLRPSGQVSVVDNEALSIDALDFDLGRTWYRWPMTRAQREAYFDGYGRYRNSADFVAHFPYWGIVALVGAAAFRSRPPGGDAAVPVRRLRGLLHDLEEGVPGTVAVFRS